MINMKVTVDELLADPTHAAVHVVNRLWIYTLDELIQLASASCSLLQTTMALDIFRMPSSICLIPSSLRLRMIATILSRNALDLVRIRSVGGYGLVVLARLAAMLISNLPTLGATVELR